MKNLPPLITGLLFLISIHALSAQCPAYPQLSGVQHGLFTLDDLTPTDPNAHTDVIAFKQYSVPLKSPLINPKILLTLASISALTSTIDLFDINIIAKTQTQFVLGFIYEPLKWKKISYRYLISNRTDLGFQMITLSSLSFKSSNNNSIIAQAELDQDLQNFQKYQALSFIRGLKYKNNDLVDHSLSVSINSSTLSSTTISFNISAMTNSSKIELQLLSVSYLYFDAKQASYESFGGLILRNNFVGKDIVDILHADLPTNLYWLYGLTNIKIAGNNFSLSSEITEDSFFNLETSLAVTKIQFTYFAVAAKASQVCLNCPDKIKSGDFCVKDCSQNQIYYIFKDGSKACQKCQTDLSPNAQRTKCIQTDSTQTSEKTQPSVQYQQSEAYTPVNPNQKDEGKSGNTAVEKVQTSSSSSSEAVKADATASAEANQINLPPGAETSVFPNTILQEFNYCNSLEHSYWTGESCQCKVGFKLILGACVSLIEIEESKDNEAPEKITPVQNIKPSHHGHPDRGSNIDADDTNLVSLIAEPHVSTCPTDLQVYNAETEQCECKKGLGFKVNLVDHLLECANCSSFSGFYLEKGRCQHCGDYQLYDEAKKVCVCRDGYVFDTSNECVAVQSKPVSGKASGTVALSNEVPPPQTTTNTEQTTQTSTQRKRNRDDSSLISQTSQTTTTVSSEGSSTQVSDGTKPTTVYTVPSTTTETSTQTVATASQPKPAPSSTKASPLPAPLKPLPQISTTISPSTSSPTTTPSSNPLPAPAECMKLMKTPQINAANIYISLELSSEKSFRSEDEMQNFLKQDFSDDFSKPSSVYCMQSEESQKEFDCLLLYPTGVPNSNFEVRFWHNESSGSQCSLKIKVNPLESATKSMRSLRRRP